MLTSCIPFLNLLLPPSTNQALQIARFRNTTNSNSNNIIMAESNGNEMKNGGNNPSMLHGHAAYVAGAAKETIAPYTSQPAAWTSAASETKSAAIDEMRAAKALRSEKEEPAHNASVGAVEEKVGGAVGCEGMVEEGRARRV